MSYDLSGYGFNNASSAVQMGVQMQQGPQSVAMERLMQEGDCALINLTADMIFKTFHSYLRSVRSRTAFGFVISRKSEVTGCSFTNFPLGRDTLVKRTMSPTWSSKFCIICMQWYNKGHLKNRPLAHSAWKRAASHQLSRASHFAFGCSEKAAHSPSGAYTPHPPQQGTPAPRSV
eukprot:scaffold121329_cov23-Tisochrysis_lutea.AAC.2